MVSIACESLPTAMLRNRGCVGCRASPSPGLLKNAVLDSDQQVVGGESRRSFMSLPYLLRYVSIDCVGAASASSPIIVLSSKR